MNAPGGTAYGSRVPGIDICGKTGTVQVVTQKEAKKTLSLPENLRDHGWFVGFAPRNDPKIVVAVFVEHGLHGSSAAGPLAAKLAAAWLQPPAAAAPAAVTAAAHAGEPPPGSGAAR